MKKTTVVLASVVILAFGLFLLLKNATNKNNAATEPLSSKAEVLPENLLTKYKSTFESAVTNASSNTEDESRQLSQEQKDLLMDEFIIAFWEELGLSDNASLEEKRLSLGLFDRPYMNTLTEREFFQLSPEDQEKAMAEVVDTAKKTRAFVKDVIAEAKSCITNKDYTRAEACLMYGLEVGRELSSNKDGLFITRMVGISCERSSMNELVNLYTQVGDHTGVQRSKEYISHLDTEVEEMRETAKQIEDQR